MTDEFRVAVKNSMDWAWEVFIATSILDCRSKGEDVWYSKLRNMFKNDKTSLINKMVEDGLLNGQWEETDGGWRCTLVVRDGFANFIRGLKNGND